jgi:hypothetical protein
MWYVVCGFWYALPVICRVWYLFAVVGFTVVTHMVRYLLVVWSRDTEDGIRGCFREMV